MNGQVIGRTMSHGYAGSYARQPDSVIDSHPLGGADGVPFGMAVVRDSSDASLAVLPSESTTAAEFLGVAVREIKSAVDYLNQNQGKYVPGEAVPVMKRGCVNVKCQDGIPAAGGAVYLRVKENEAKPGAAVGGFEAATDSTNSVALTNCQWAGTADSNGIAEMRIMTILNA